MHLLRGALLLLCGFTAWAGPREFGLQGYEAAVRARGLKPERYRIQAMLDSGAPGSFKIRGRSVLGGDLRRLMYGLLEAAGQIRENGRLRETAAEPAFAVRAVRVAREALPSGESLRLMLEVLATARFNTLIVLPGPPAELREAAAGYGLKLAGADGLVGLYPVTLPLEELAAPWADPVSARRILAQADWEGSAGIVVPARLPAPEHELFYAVWGLEGYAPGAPPKRWPAMLRGQFGTAAERAWEALTLASRCLTFLPPEQFLLGPAMAVRSPATARYSPLQLAAAWQVLARQAEAALDPFRASLGAVQPLIAYGRARASEMLAGGPAAGGWTRSALPEPVAFTHLPPKGAVAGRPVTLRLGLPARARAERVRLHWRDARGTHAMESRGARASFTLIPEGEVRYYFEVVSPSGSGWFYPDPLAGSPYLRLNVRPAPHP